MYGKFGAMVNVSGRGNTVTLDTGEDCVLMDANPELFEELDRGASKLQEGQSK
jgi:hypothetical protein